MLSEYYKSLGQALPSVSERAKIAANYGITNYTGTAEQNNSLESKLRAGGTTAPTNNNQVTPATTTPASSVSSGGSSGNYDINAIVNAMMGKGYNDRAAAESVARANPEQYAKEYLGITPATGGATSGATTINLEEKYNSLLAGSGITETQNKITAKQAELTALENEAAAEKAKQGENPFLSEAALNGRIAKIDKKFNDKSASLKNEIANLQGEVTTKKNDVANSLNLTVQQYNIDKAAKQENLANFNTLLSSKALVGATPADIATLAAQTGLAPSFIQSAIAQSQVKEPQIITQTDDSGNVTIVSIDKTSGEILKTVSAGKIAGSKTSAGGETADVKTSFLNDANTVKGQSIDGTWVGQFPQLVMKYASTMSLQDIYKLYLTTPLGKKYGTPTENAADIQALYSQARGE